MIRSIGLFVFLLVFVFGLSQFSAFESNQAMVSTLFSGSITQGNPVNILYFASHFLLAELYMSLYSKVSSIPWYEIIMFGYVVISLYVVITILIDRNQLSNNKTQLYLFIGFVLIISTVYILFMESTRVAFALGAASTLLLIANRPLKTLSLPFFLVCLLTRPEVGVLILVIQWMSYWLITNRNMSLRLLGVNTFFVVTIIGHMAYDRMTTNEFIKHFEPELGYQLLDRGNIVPLRTMTNEVDSAKYKAVLNMITDSAYTSIEFLQSLVGNDPYTGFSKELITRSAQIFFESIYNSLGLFVIYLSILLLLLYQSPGSKFSDNKRIILFNIFYWLIIAATIYGIKMEEWVFSSSLSVVCFILLSQLEIASIKKTKPLVVFCGIALIIGSAVLIKQEQIYLTDLKTETSWNAKFTNLIKEKFQGKIIVPSIDQTLMLTHSFNPYHVPDFSAFHRFYLIDCDLLYLEKHYNSYLLSECNCNAGSYTDLWDFLESKKDSVVVISDETRISAIKDYCSVVRHKDYNFTPIDTITQDANRSVVYIFE